MKTVELRIAAPVWDALRAYHLDPAKRVEALSYLFAGVEKSEGAIRILVPHNAPLFRFDGNCFESRSGAHLRLHDDVQRGLLISFARSHHPCLINVHDHWFAYAGTTFSRVDDADDISFDRYLRERFEPALPRIDGAIARPVWNLALVLGRNGADARLVDTRHPDPFRRVARLTITGERYRTVPLGKRSVPHQALGACHSRHRDFIGAEHQAALTGLHAAVVGAGGIGSILTETLGRIGLGAVTVIDGDTLDETNLNRWQGGKPWMTGKPKARLLARQLRSMFPRMRVRYLASSVFDRAAERLLREADVLFGAVDADEPRIFLNRLALQQLAPYFDVGVAVSGAGDDAVEFRARMFAVYPGESACLECTGFKLFDRPRVEAAFLDPLTAAERCRAGYVTEQPEIAAPSVYALNQRSVGMAVTEFLNWVCGWRPTATVVSESWRRGTLERADRENFPERPDPDCAVCGYLAGAGPSEPLPRPAAFARRTSPSFVTKEPNNVENQTCTH
jgi:hypothetical protein